MRSLEDGETVQAATRTVSVNPREQEFPMNMEQMKPSRKADSLMAEIVDALDTISSAYWHVEMIAMACRYTPGDDAKAFAAVTHTALEKLVAAQEQFKGVCQHLREVAA